MAFRWAILFGVVLIGGTALACPPPLMLWAWERPDDLRNLDPRTSGVAYLAKTLTLTTKDVVVSNRRQPLLLPPGLYRIPVIRIDTARRISPSLSSHQADRLLAEIVRLARSDVPGVQIDYDAPYSQRNFYARLLADVRAQLPARASLSITALASWALFDPWIASLPIDEAVPMLFRMGADAAAVRRYLSDGGDVRTALARRSLGLSTDEPLPLLPADRRVWIFSPTRWTPASTRQAIAEVRSWQGSVRCDSSS